MSARFLRFAGLFFVLSAILLLGACHKKSVPAPTAPPPPAPAKPTATLSVSPTNVQQGQSVQLVWSTQNATDVSIEALGAIALTGTRSVVPSESKTYTLTAKGPGGMVQETARVTVTVPTPGIAPVRSNVAVRIFGLTTTTFVPAMVGPTPVSVI